MVERENGVIRHLALGMWNDAEFFRLNLKKDYEKVELMSSATHISNMLYGSKLLSSFELARGSTPTLRGLSQSKVSNNLQEAFEEQKARRALEALEKGRAHLFVNKDYTVCHTKKLFITSSVDLSLESGN